MNAEILEGPAAVLDAECVLRVLCQRLQNELDAVELCNLYLSAAYASIRQHSSAFVSIRQHTCTRLPDPSAGSSSSSSSLRSTCHKPLSTLY